jgi:hypothetical protein
MSKFLYVRNQRPNRLVVRYADLRIVLERRGSREDATALPEEARQDRTISRWFTDGKLEEITQDQFESLKGRLEDEPMAPLKHKAVEVNLPMNPPAHVTPTLIDADNAELKEEFMSPHLEFADPPKPTDSANELVEEANSNERTK